MDEPKVAYCNNFCYFGCQLVQALAIVLHSILDCSTVCPQKIGGAQSNLVRLSPEFSFFVGKHINSFCPRAPRSPVTPLQLIKRQYTDLLACRIRCDLPLELFEILLMRTYLMLYCVSDPCPLSGKRSPERQAFSLLASVCSYWHQTLSGWPTSPTPKWVRHHLKKLINGE